MYENQARKLLLSLFFRSWYKETASPVNKDIVIVFDKSNSMNSKMDQVKDAILAVLESLGPNDRVSVQWMMVGGESANGDTINYQWGIFETLASPDSGVRTFHWDSQ